MKPKPKFQQLGMDDRRTIAIGREQGLSIRAIARILNRAPSTISREIARNAPTSTYSCSFAQQRFLRRRRFGRPKPKLQAGNALFEQVCQMLRRQWSPEQIAHHLALHRAHEAHCRVSHETIYNVIYAQPRGELKRELVA